MSERPRDPASGLPFSRLVEAFAAGSDEAWAVHFRALEKQAAGEEVIVLSVGDPDFDTPSVICEAAVAALRAGETRYTLGGGITPLRERIAEIESERLGFAVSAGEIVVCAGAQNAIYNSLRCLVEAGDEVVIFGPPYVMFDGVVAASGATPRRVPLDAATGFRIDRAALEAAVSERTRAILLNSPHNPTGAVASPAELEAVAALCRERGLWLISDEVYADLCYDGDFQSPACLPGMRERTVVVRSLSKSHAMSGWRVGWVVAPKALCDHMVGLIYHALYGGAAFTQRGALAALTEPIPEVAAMKQAYRERRDFLCAAIERIEGLHCIKPESGIFCLMDVGGLGLPTKLFAERLLECEGVSVLPGDAFDPAIGQMVRVSLCQPRPLLEEAVKRIKRFASAVRAEAAAPRVGAGG